MSGNPGGRPKAAPEFRALCRVVAGNLLEQLEAKVRMGDMPTEDELNALAAFSDRGGYLTGDKLAAAEVARARVFIEILGTQGLSEEQRKAILARWETHEQEALAAVSGG